MGGAKELHDRLKQHRVVWSDLAVKSSDFEGRWSLLIK
jgi:hypothetical protein